jgi:hypothetical protein
VADLAYDDERIAYLHDTQVPFVLVGTPEGGERLLFGGH